MNWVNVKFLVNRRFDQVCFFVTAKSYVVCKISPD